MQLTRIFFLANRAAWLRVYWMSAALTAPYGGKRCRAQARDRRNVNDRAAVALEKGRAACDARTLAIRSTSMLMRQPFLVVGAAEARCVVHEDVDAAERGGRVFHVFRDGRGVCEIASGGVDLPALRLQLGLGLLQRLGAARTDGDVRAALGKPERDRAANAAAGAGDDDVLSGE
jgi:hypothetical protein